MHKKEKYNKIENKSFACKNIKSGRLCTLMKRKTFFDLIDAILIACGFVVRPTRFDHHAVTLLQACRAHLFTKLSKSYRPRTGCSKNRLTCCYQWSTTRLLTYTVEYRIFYQYKSIFSASRKPYYRTLSCAEMCIYSSIFSSTTCVKVDKDY